MREPTLKIRVTPVAGLLGLGLIGYGLNGTLGAGVGLVLPNFVVVVSRLIYEFLTRPYADRRRRKTLRHRFFLWNDRRQARNASKLRQRAERKVAERRYMDGRARRRAAGDDEPRL
jgi:hypothetical protein